VLLVLGVEVSWPKVTVPTHVSWTIPVALLAIFSHAIILFYFIGTGSRIKEVVKEFKLDVNLYRRTLAFKSRVFPLSTLTMALIIAATILGGGAHTRFAWTPPLLHGVVAFGAAILNTILSLREVACISENLTLVDEVDQAVLSATR
jgi:hypothetical protein